MEDDSTIELGNSASWDSDSHPSYIYLDSDLDSDSKPAGLGLGLESCPVRLGLGLGSRHAGLGLEKTWTRCNSDSWGWTPDPFTLNTEMGKSGHDPQFETWVSACSEGHRCGDATALA